MFERKYSLSYLTIVEKLSARKEVKRKRQKDLDKKKYWREVEQLP